MKIERIKSQHRRDFVAVYVCESCGHEEEGSGYDDNYFHRTVIPKMVCSSCGETSPESYRALSPKYAESEVL